MECNKEEFENVQQYDSVHCDYKDIKHKTNLEEVKIEPLLDEDLIGQQQRMNLNIKTEEIVIKEEHLSPSSSVTNKHSNLSLSINTQWYECTICHKQSTSNDVLETHTSIVHRADKRYSEKSYDCQMCIKRFIRAQDLEIHEQQHVKDKPLNCNKGRKEIRLTSSINNHKCIQEEHECNICHERFVHISNLRTHACAYRDEMLYECTICYKRFACKNTITTHMHTIHIKRDKYECSICQVLFPCKRSLDAHVQIHIEPETYECDICHKQTNSKFYLIQHRRVHTGERPYECDICHKRFISSSSRNAHRVVHTNEKPYECNICHKHFKQKNSLASHRQYMHIKDETHECSICHKRSITKGTLVVHMRTHTKQQIVADYECDICHRKIKTKAYLIEHMRVHTGERPYECDICHKRFKQTSALASHKLVHADEKKYECSICHKRFKQPSGLYAHKRSHVK